MQSLIFVHTGDGGKATLTGELTTRGLGNHLPDVLGRAMYGGKGIGVTRNGKLAAVVVSVEDFEALEEFEMDQNAAAYRAAKAEFTTAAARQSTTLPGADPRGRRATGWRSRAPRGHGRLSARTLPGAFGSVITA